MANKIILLVGLIQMGLFAVNPCRGQDSTKILVLSPRVGANISAAEREQFHIFRHYDNFVEATVFQKPDGNCYARITLETVPGVFRDAVVRCTSQWLLMTADKINHFEALNAGSYTLGEEAAYILTADGQPVLKSPAVLRSLTETDKRVLSHACKWWDNGPPGGMMTLGLSSGESLQGKILRVVDDSMFTFESKGRALLVPVDSVSHLLRHGGSYFWQGAGIGAMTGIVAGAAIGAATYKREGFPVLGRGDHMVAGAVVGIPVGFVVGGLVGASVEEDDLIDVSRSGYEVKLMVIRMMID